MFTKVWHWLLLLVFGPVVAAIVAAYVFTIHPEGGSGSEMTVVIAGFLMLGLPVIALKGAFSAGKTSWHRRIEREADLRFARKNGRRIREARAQSW
jgi:hypothetical protein